MSCVDIVTSAGFCPQRLFPTSLQYVWNPAPTPTALAPCNWLLHPCPQLPAPPPKVPCTTSKPSSICDQIVFLSRRALEQRKKAEEKEERWRERQKQREKKLQRVVLKRAQANDPHLALSQTQQTKLKEFRCPENSTSELKCCWKGQSVILCHLQETRAPAQEGVPAGD